MIVFDRTIFESNSIHIMELKAGYNPRRFTLTVVGSNFDRLFDTLYLANLIDTARNEHHIDYVFNLTTPYVIVHLGLFLSKLRTFESNITNTHFEEIPELNNREITLKEYNKSDVLYIIYSDFFVRLIAIIRKNYA